MFSKIGKLKTPLSYIINFYRIKCVLVSLNIFLMLIIVLIKI